MKTLFGTFLLLLILALPVFAEAPQTFSLISQNSNVGFKIDSAVLPIEGKIERYSGKVIKVGKLANQFEIYLDIELSSIKITGDATQGLPIAELLSSVKNSTAHFEGKPFSQKPDGTLNIRGDLKWRGKSYLVTFPVRVKSDNTEMVFEGKISSNGEQLAEEIPVLSMFQVQNASANAKLTFRKLPQNFNSSLAS